MSKQEKRWELKIDASPSSLGQVADFVEGICETLGLDEDDAFAIQLATDEACQNAVVHACRYDDDQQVTVVGEQLGPDLRIEIRECGAPFDPATVRPPRLRGRLSNRNGGGLGLHFMRHMMDDVRFDQADDGANRVIMIKKGVIGKVKESSSPQP
jgi:serine/threonine-protein kinase RsbW